MEPNFAPVVTPREILYHLPELISGRDPVLGNPLARRLMLANPKCREALLAVTAIWSTFAQVEVQKHNLEIARDARFRKVHDDMRRVSKSETANLMYEAAVFEVDRHCAEHSSFVLESTAPRRLSRGNFKRLIQFDGPGIGQRRPGTNPLTAAKQLLGNAEALAPGSFCVAFMTMFIKRIEHGTSSVRNALELATRTTRAIDQSAALGAAARTALEQGDIKSSADLYIQAVRMHSGYATNTYGCALTLTLLGDPDGAARHLDSLLDLQLSNSQRDHLRRAILIDSRLWLTTAEGDRNTIRRIFDATRSDPRSGRTEREEKAH